MPPKKIPQPAADPSRHPSQHANERRVAQYNAAKRDDEMQAYTAGQQAAKRTIQGYSGYMRQVRHDPVAAKVAHDALEEGRIGEAHLALGLSMGSLDSWDDDPDKKVRDAFRQGYIEGFAARIRKLAYPGVRLKTDRQLDAEIDAHLRSRR